MIKLFKIIIVITIFISPKTGISADVSGYLLNKAIKEFHDKNYEEAYESLKNIAPTGNPVAAYLLGQMYLKGLGIQVNNKVAYDMILYSSQKLFQHDKALALESQITLSDMYDKGIGTDENKLESYMWAYIAHKTSENMHIAYLKKLKNNLSSQDITDVEKKALKLFNNIIKD